jgi:uncharacterized coiled-coil protein SlyX
MADIKSITRMAPGEREYFPQRFKIVLGEGANEQVAYYRVQDIQYRIDRLEHRRALENQRIDVRVAELQTIKAQMQAELTANPDELPAVDPPPPPDPKPFPAPTAPLPPGHSTSGGAGGTP